MTEAAARATPTTSAPGLGWRRSGSARQALDEAAEIAGAQGVRLDVPHLVAAFIFLPDFHDKDLHSLGLDRARWGAAFVQHRAARARSDAELEDWKQRYARCFPKDPLPPLALEPRRGHRPDYDTDAYTSHDLLDINDEVEALGYVVAAEQTSPPLAIGLFGEWGSGKTFFMKHLRAQVERLSRGARAQPPAERALRGHIVQVEFNAWHYQDSDLWASLVDHILRNLRFGDNEDEAKLAERRDDIVRQIEVSERREKAATDSVAAANQRVEAAEQTLDNLKQQTQERREALYRALPPAQILTASGPGSSSIARSANGVNGSSASSGSTRPGRARGSSRTRWQTRGDS